MADGIARDDIVMAIVAQPQTISTHIVDFAFLNPAVARIHHDHGCIQDHAWLHLIQGESRVSYLKAVRMHIIDMRAADGITIQADDLMEPRRNDFLALHRPVLRPVVEPARHWIQMPFAGLIEILQDALDVEPVRLVVSMFLVAGDTPTSA